MNRIDIRYDQRRGCGWRKPGGLYLVTDGLSRACAKLPVPLTVCPTCHAGIKPARGWTWVDADALVVGAMCLNAQGCGACPLAYPFGRAGLLWVGEKYCPTPGDWEREAVLLGVSRRIAAVPNDFVLGETWVLVAHRKAILRADGRWIPGVFHAFRPKAVEYVVRGDETDEALEVLKARGITPVRVERAAGSLV
jgi:hypothetical protein